MQGVAQNTIEQNFYRLSSEKNREYKYKCKRGTNELIKQTQVNRMT